MPLVGFNLSRYMCSVDGCTKPQKTRTMCGAHYSQARRAEVLAGKNVGVCKTCDAEIPYLGVGRPRYQCDGCKKLRPSVDCSVEGCCKPAKSRGWCFAHYAYWRKHGHPGSVGDGRRRKEGPNGSSKSSAGEGYVRLWFADPDLPGRGRHVLEHRYVMERVLGRPLEKHENVHHLNGIRSDNRPENLEIWVEPQPKGQRPSDLADWVVDHYPELVEAALARRTQLKLIA